MSGGRKLVVEIENDFWEEIGFCYVEQKMQNVEVCCVLYKSYVVRDEFSGNYDVGDLDVGVYFMKN